MRIWDLSSLPPVYPNTRVTFGDAKWSPDGRYLAANAYVGEVVNDYHGWMTNLEGLIDWSPDGTRLIGTQWPKAVIVNAKTGDVVMELNHHRPTRWCLFYSRIGPRMAAWWQVPALQAIGQSLGPEHGRGAGAHTHLRLPLDAPHVLSDSQLLATGLYILQKGTHLCGYSMPYRRAGARAAQLGRLVGFHQSGHRMASTWRLVMVRVMVRIWKLPPGKVVQSFTAHKKEVWDVNWVTGWHAPGSLGIGGGIGYVWISPLPGGAEIFSRSIDLQRGLVPGWKIYCCRSCYHNYSPRLAVHPGADRLCQRVLRHA